jgi:hypothetical protein
MSADKTAVVPVDEQEEAAWHLLFEAPPAAEEHNFNKHHAAVKKSLTNSDADGEQS